MATIYVLQDKDAESSGNNGQVLPDGSGEVQVGAGKNDSNSHSLATTPPIISSISTFTTTVKPHQTRVFSSISVHSVSPTDQGGSQNTDTRRLRPKATSETDGNFHSGELLL